MKPAPFDYHAPESLPEALELMSRFSDEGKPLAGGQSLVPMMALRLARFGQLIDLNGVEELDVVRPENGHLVIGAITRQAVLEVDEEVAEMAPLIAEATRLIGHFQIRSRGTLGGSLAHADPAAEYPAVALALGASLDVASTRGTRTISADELLEAAYVTTLAADEIVTAVRVPVAQQGDGFAIREIARRHGDFALAGCAAKVSVGGGGAVQDARVVLFGVSGRALRAEPAEQALVAAGTGAPDLDAALAVVGDGLEPPEDAVATSAYRKKAARHIAREAITAALQNARQGGVPA
jgi:carbon-monoxide dehydrogenase medium subunit